MVPSPPWLMSNWIDQFVTQYSSLLPPRHLVVPDQQSHIVPFVSVVDISWLGIPGVARSQLNRVLVYRVRQAATLNITGVESGLPCSCSSPQVFDDKMA